MLVKSLRLVLTVACLSLFGCGKHAIDAVRRMRDSACAGNSAAFFAHVDRKEIANAALAKARDDFEPSLLKLGPIERVAATEAFEGRVKDQIPAGVQETLTEWEENIKQRGPASHLCRMSVVDSSEVESTADVHVVTPTGKDHHWRMAKVGSDWLLVRVGV